MHVQEFLQAVIMSVAWSWLMLDLAHLKVCLLCHVALLLDTAAMQHCDTAALQPATTWHCNNVTVRLCDTATL